MGGGVVWSFVFLIIEDYSFFESFSFLPDPKLEIRNFQDNQTETHTTTVDDLMLECVPVPIC